ncbi:MAG: NAD(P)-dependent oxidoreductase [Acidobacteriia bacterium]|nr:NAD(P)-dependent oxidoreductase [Terriglobia bacterium]
MRVAFLGLGIMGRPMAAKLAQAGHEVTAWSRSAGKHVEGARIAVSPAEAARGAEVVWVCVSDTAAVERVLFSADGVESVLEPGMIVADSSTIAPSATRKFAERVRARGADYVDAPITGSKVGAESGQLIFIVGGAEATIARLEPLFSVMGKKVLHMGPTGHGQSAKLGGNLMISMMFEGFAEALTLTSKLGVPRERFMELVNASMIRSGVSDYKAPFVLRHDFSPNFPLRLMHKDIHLMLEAAREARVKLPGLETVEEIYEVATEEGSADLDYASTLALLEKWAGIDSHSSTS